MGSSVITDFKPVDVFAYAMIGFYVLTGTKPWDEMFSNDIENRVIKGDRPVIPKNISEANGDLITKCWGQNPRNRLTFDEIVKILK